MSICKQLDLSKAMEDSTNKRIEALERERDAILKNIDALAELDFVYNYRNIFVDERDIQHQIDVLNKKFREDAEVRLDTSGIQNDLDKIKGYYDELKNRYDSFESSMKLPEVDKEAIDKLEKALSKIKEEGALEEVKSTFEVTGETIEEITKELETMLDSERFSIEQHEEKSRNTKKIAEEQAKQIKSNEEEAKRLKEK